MMTPPLIYILVLTDKMKAQLAECLESLRPMTYPNFRVLAVDNGSEDGTVEMLREQFPEVDVFETGENLGYQGGANRAVDYALRRGADYVMIINPDAVVINPGLLDQMSEFLESNPRVGIAGPRVYLGQSHRLQNTVLFAPGLWKSFAHWLGYRLLPASPALSRDRVVDAETPNGVCLMIRAETLRDIGLFDECIFMYIEDAEMDWRARRKGWRVRYLPIEGVIHKQRLEGYRTTGQVSFLLKRNSVYFLCKTGKHLDAWGYAAFSLALLFLRGVASFDPRRRREYLAFTQRLARAYRLILFH